MFPGITETWTISNIRSLDRIRSSVRDGDVKIITRIGRSGKSTMLKELDGVIDGKIICDHSIWLFASSVMLSIGIFP